VREPFKDASPEERVFYSRVFFNCLLNLNAVQMGFYPTLLCETDDPMAGLRWKQALPSVLVAMKQRRDDGPLEER
jgi:hypothetical protein